MDETLKKVANEGLDLIGGAVIKLLPVDGEVKNAMKVGLDIGTDLIFDSKKGEDVSLKDHTEIVDLANNLVPLILGLVDKNILKVIDIPFLNEVNEVMFERGVMLQLEAVLRQAIEDFLTRK